MVDYAVKNDRVFFVGTLSPELLISLYKRSEYFIHLAWLDHCPNVVVDARASGCKVICSSAGGTKEIAGPGAIIIEEQEWDMSPVDLYNPPLMNFNKKIYNNQSTGYNMNEVFLKYKYFMKGSYEQ